MLLSLHSMFLCDYVLIFFHCFSIFNILQNSYIYENNHMKDPHKNLDRLLKRKDFKSEKDLKEFLDLLIGTQLPDADDLTDSEKAQDLIEEAQDLPPKQA